MQYERRLLDQLVGDFRDIIPRILHELLECSNRKIKDGRKESRYYCATYSAKLALHIGDCFERYYHTLQEYRTCHR